LRPEQSRKQLEKSSPDVAPTTLATLKQLTVSFRPMAVITTQVCFASLSLAINPH